MLTGRPRTVGADDQAIHKGEKRLAGMGLEILEEGTTGLSTARTERASSRYSPVNGATRKVQTLHAPHLDGIRGFAAMMVVWEHSQTHFAQGIGITTFNKSGYVAVRIFFALSAFLVTYRSLIEWYQFVEDPKLSWDWRLDSLDRSPAPTSNGKHSILNGQHLGKPRRTDRGTDYWYLRLRQSFSGALQKHRRIRAGLGLLSRVSSRIRPVCKEFWNHHLWGRASKIWMSYLTRRMLRIYPPFVAMLIALCTLESWADSYWYLINSANFWQYIFLQNAEFIFWSIRPEVQYYFMVPLLVMAYQICDHLGGRWGPKKGNVALGSVLGRLFVIFIMFRLRAPTMIEYWEKHKGKLESQAGHFLMGSVAAMIWFEVERHGWVPPDRHNASDMNRSSEASLRGQQQIWKGRVASAVRLSADLCCYYICWKIISCMPRYAAKLYGTDPSFDEGMDYEIQWGGLLYAGLILASLFAGPSSTFPRLASWSLLRFFGKISFDVYLLHPVIIYAVNNFTYWRDSIGPIGASRVEIEVRENRYFGFDQYHDANNARLDATLLSFLGCLVFGYVAHLAIEKPSMNLTKRICKRYFSIKSA